jgi:hypothetical protein
MCIQSNVFIDTDDKTVKSDDNIDSSHSIPKVTKEETFDKEVNQSKT